jgi:RHS repeat-associated protein
MDRKRRIFFGFSGLLLLLLCGSDAQAQAPTITSISPASGPVGSVVILTGTNFGTTEGSSTVSLNSGPNAVVTSWSGTSIAVIVPTGASSGTFAVSVGGQNATSATFTVTPLPSGWSDSDIGTVGLSGSSSYANGVFTVEGAGGGMGSRADAMHFVYEPLTGSGSIVARIVSLSGGASYEQAGVIVRQALTSGSISASTLFSSNDVYLQYRSTTGNPTSNSGQYSTPLPYWVEVVWNGSSFSGYMSLDGVNWSQVGSTQTISMGSSVYVGLGVSSDSTTELATAEFDNISINSSATPAPVITSLSATNASIGSQVVINGANFGAAQGGNLVMLSDSPVPIDSWTDTAITITVPTGATSGPLVVSSGASMNDSNPVTLVITSQPLPGTWLDQDIGQAQYAGSASYSNGVFTIKGASGQIGSTADVTHFVYQQLSGNGSIIARVASLQGATGAQAGVMIRQTLNSGDLMADSIYWGSEIYYQKRISVGGNASTVTYASGSLPSWVQIVWSGNSFSVYTSPNGYYWTQLGTTQTVAMATDVYVGLVVSSGSTTTQATATFDNVSINSEAMPAPVITGVSATTGPVGSQILVSGYNFGTSQGNSLVMLNAAPVTVNSWSDTAISVTIPSGATSGLLVVSVAPSMNDSNPVQFTITSQPLPSSVLDQDVGKTASVGTATYSNGVYTVTGSGSSIGGSADAMHFAYTPLSGNGMIVARITGVSGTSGPQAGVMIRETLNPSATMAYTEYRLGYVYFGYRTTTGGAASVSQQSYSESLPYWVEVVRSGSSFSSYMSLDGVNWAQIGSTETINMATNVYIGLAVSSESTTASATGTFDNISFSSSTSPAPAISGVSATTGPVGSQVTITGTGFGTAQGSSEVFLNDLAATVNSWTATSISITLPSGATTGPLVVAVAPSMDSSNPVTFTVTSQPLPSGWSDQDVGVVPAEGNSSYASGVFTVKGTGHGVYSTTDGFHFVYVPLSGNGTIVARVASLSGSSSEAGVMIRETMNQAATVAFSEYNADEYVWFPYRTSTGGTPTSPDASAGALPYWVEVVRSGSTFSAYMSSNGSNWVEVGTSQTINMATNVFIGLAVANGTTSSTLATATFDNVSVSNSSSPPAPVISNVAPAAAPAGTVVTLTGTTFQPVQGNSTVTVDGVSATVQSWNETSINVWVPTTLSAGSTSIVVTVGGQASNGASFAVLPAVTSIYPTSAAVGGSITIYGATFGATQGSSTVYFNGVAATSVTNWSTTQIVAAVPTGATTGPVTVTVNSAQSNPTTSFTLINPVISSLSPDWGPIGGTIVVNGSGFGTSQGNGQISFNGSTYTGAAGSWTDTQIAISVPSWATTGPVTVTTAGLTSNGVEFTVEGSLAVTGISPTAGPVGSSVTISGTGFGPSQGTSTVTMNAVPLSVSSWSDTQIVAAVPTGTITGAVMVNEESLSASGPTFTINSTVQLTDSLGNQSSYTADMYGGEWYMGQAQGSGCSTCSIRGTISNTFDNNGNVLTTTDELGLVTTYTYDSDNDVTSITQPTVSAGTPTTTYTYNNFGEVLTSTDPLGNVTTNTYDAHGNLLSVAAPAPSGNTAASVTQFTYNSLGELTQIQDALHRVTTMTYTSAGLIASITNPQANVTSYGYDSRGNRTSVTDALNHTTTFTYDSGNRLTQITYPDTTTASFTYDYRGRRITATDQNGKTTQYAYDAADRLTSVTDAGNNVTQYAYDTEDNLVSITDANSHVTNFTYDAFGRVTKTTFPSNYYETYGYDADNNLTSKTDRNGNTIQYVYDALNRLAQKNYPDSTSMEYTYDLVGKILQVNDPTGTYGFAYDNMGRLIGTTTQYSFLTGTNFTNSYTYDADSNRTGYTAPDGSTNTYSYDTLNRLTTLANSWAGSFGFSYDALSRRTQMTRPNGVSTSYSYDNLSRLLSVLHELSGSTIDGAVYTVDSAGNRTSKADDLANVTTNYGYDSIYELFQATQGSTTTESYTYDPVGNRLSSLSVSSYTNNSSNELTATSNGSYTYDYNGNTTSKTDSTGTTSYSWDYENRLTSVTLPNSGGTVSFKYDPFGRRIEKISPATTSVFAYDGDSLVETVNSSGGVVARYAQAPGIDQPLAMQRGTTTSYYEQDGIGSVTSLTATNGTVSQSYSYDSFGNTTNSSGSLTNFFRYTAREFDTETDLYYYRTRYYDPAAGRFISEDPIGFKGGIDFYTYVTNRPVDLADPTGLKGCVDCTTAAPLPSNSPKCDEYGSETYLGASESCFCKCAGDSAWAQKVRGCLSCAFENGIGKTARHKLCYDAAGWSNAPWVTLANCERKCLFAH